MPRPKHRLYYIVEAAPGQWFYYEGGKHYSSILRVNTLVEAKRAAKQSGRGAVISRRVRHSKNGVVKWLTTREWEYNGN